MPRADAFSVPPPSLRAALSAVVAALLLAAVSATPAQAHARLIASDPADQATVDEAPLEVVLRFNEEVSADFAVVQVTDPAGTRVDAETPDVAGETVHARLLPLSEAGTYQVAYRVVSNDGHPIEGSLSFTLSDAAVAPAPPEPADDPAPTPEPAPEPAPAPGTEAAAPGGDEPVGASEPAPEPTAAPTAVPTPETEPTEAATELAAARGGSSGISPGVLVAVVAVLVLLAGVGFLATRRGGSDDATGPDEATPTG